MLGHASAAAGKKEALKILEELKARSEKQYVPHTGSRDLQRPLR